MSALAQGQRHPPAIVVSIALVCSVGFIDGMLTNPSPWHTALVRPSWHPPAWVFGPAWALIGICAAFAFAKAWDVICDGRGRMELAFRLSVNAVLNVAWSALFFAAHRPDYALVDIGALWISIAGLVGFLLRRRARAAARLLAPYLVWVSIASVLTYEIVRLNGPF